MALVILGLALLLAVLLLGGRRSGARTRSGKAAALGIAVAAIVVILALSDLVRRLLAS